MWVVSGNRGKYRDGKYFDDYDSAYEYMQTIMRKGRVSEAGISEVSRNCHVTIIGERSKEEITKIKEYYHKLGFTVDHVDDMKGAVKGVMNTVKGWQ